MDSSDYYESYTPQDYANIAALEYQNLNADLTESIIAPSRKRTPKPKNCYPRLHRSRNQKIRNHQTKYTNDNFTSPHTGRVYEILCGEKKPIILEGLEAAVIQFEKYLGAVGEMKIIAFTIFSKETKRGQSEANDLMRSLRGKFGKMAFFKTVEVNREGTGKHYAIMIGIPLDDHKRITTIKAIHKSWANISSTAVHIDKTYEVRSLEDLTQPVAYLSYHCKVRTKAFDKKSEPFYTSSRLKPKQLEQLYDRSIEKKERWIPRSKEETREPAQLKACGLASGALKPTSKNLISIYPLPNLTLFCNRSSKTNPVIANDRHILNFAQPEKQKRLEAKPPNIKIQRIDCARTDEIFSWCLLDKIRVRQHCRTKVEVINLTSTC